MVELAVREGEALGLALDQLDARASRGSRASLVARPASISALWSRPTTEQP